MLNNIVGGWSVSGIFLAYSEVAYNSFCRIEISRDTRDGRGVLRRLNRWFLDL